LQKREREGGRGGEILREGYRVEIVWGISFIYFASAASDPREL